MKALSIHAPYGSLIAAGIKRHETRSWRTNYRGPLAIHQGKSWVDADVAATLRPALKALQRRCPVMWANDIEHGHGIGAVVAIANLVDCVPTESLTEIDPLDRLCGDFTPGRWAWRLEVATWFGFPVPTRGRQGLFNWDPPL